MPIPLRGPSRRSPFPFDVRITSGTYGPFGYLLGKPEKGAPLIARKPAPLQPASPSEYTYSAQDPSIESTQVWSDFSEGMGLRTQKTPHDKRYYYANGIDCHVGGFIMPGPLVTSVTPTNDLDSTNGISHFFEIGSALYGLDGRYVKKRTADTAAGWGTTSKDFGVGKAALDVVVFTANSGSTTYAFVAMGDAEHFYYFDGTTWTQHGTLFALCWCSTGRKLFRASDSNLVAFVDENADPTNAANWTATNAFRVGDKTSTIIRMVTNDDGVLLIFKSDGTVFALDIEGQDVQLYSDLKGAPDATNGRWHWKHKGNLHVTMSGQHSRIRPDLSIESGIGPEKYTENDSTVHGYVTAGVGTQFCAYAALWNPDSSVASLMTFGGFAPAADDPDPKPLDVWHGSLVPIGVAPFDTKVTAMARSSIGAASGHERVYIGFTSGKVGWFTLPCTANPHACSSYTFITPNADCELFLPRWHGGFPADEKHMRSGLVSGQNLTSNIYALVWYESTEMSDTYGVNYQIGGGSGNFDTVPAKRMAFPTGTIATLLSFQIIFVGKAILTGVAITYMVRTAVKMIYQFSIICEDGLVRRDGVHNRFSASQIRTQIRDAVDTRGSCTVVLPDESSQELVFTDYSEGLAWDDRTESWRAALQVTAVQADAQNTFLHAATLS